MRYLGGKSLLLEAIGSAIRDNTENVQSVTDIFCGSGVVSNYFKHNGLITYSNDCLYFCYAIQKGTVALNTKPSFKNLGINDPIKYLNQQEISNTDINLNDCFIYNNYSPVGSCKRMYFQPKNALKIDIIRLTIEKWRKDDAINEDEYFYLLSSLLNAVPYVSNITGVYASYLKFWDKRTYNDIELKDPQKEGLIFNNNHSNLCFNQDFHSLLGLKSDLLYADPPYNEREYLPNYHILETIALYDYPIITGVTGMRNYKKQKSPFCSKKTVFKAFEDLLSESTNKYILISYNSEGLMKTQHLCELCKQYAVDGSFKLIETEYRRYKNKIPNNTPGLKEQLYFLKKR